MNLGPIAKALVGAAAAGVAPYTQAILPSSQNGAHISVGEGLVILAAILAGSALVWRADNVRWFPYAKATSAALVVFLGALAVPFLAGETASLNIIVQAVFKTAATFGLVSQVPNTTRSEWTDPAGSDGEAETYSDPDADADTDGVPTPDALGFAHGGYVPQVRGAAYLPHRILGPLAG